jgi:hypothetical protein
MWVESKRCEAACEMPIGSKLIIKFKNHPINKYQQSALYGDPLIGSERAFCAAGKCRCSGIASSSSWV